MKKLFIVVFIVYVLFSLNGCQSLSRKFGGNITINIEKGNKVVNAEWEHDTLDILTRPMHDGEFAETLTLHEHSNFGVMQSTVYIIESK